ncbi:MAG: hypothetical protein HZY79_00610 [Rhodoblastus sp.]|nr:MAG: hypothetical protein HZY79_00610 [Rhodoblastus sp.]
MDYATGQRGYHLSYRVVSGAWKAVVEEVEPDTHQFFNCDLCFTDKIVPYFIFNPRVVVEMRANKDQRIADARVPYKLPLRRSSITGRHWTSQLHFGWQFASRQLAERLLSLLPPETSFVPQWAVD